ncbi:endoribonuclease Dcr-1 [Battus philenor]|uniref:endoribonuclease Dcr-1 n=1 Tax=Battus philenor TaxID=42288 RepID=UPI0035CF60F1
MEACCTRFTAAEGGARLAAVVSAKNTIITEHCSFVATRLLHEDAYKIRGLFSEGHQRSVFLTRESRIAYVAYELGILTDLAVGQAVRYEDIEDWKGYFEEKEVLVCTSNTLKCILEDGFLNVPQINVLIIDSCHLISTDDNLRYVMQLYKQCKEIDRPRLLALTYPLFTSINTDNENLDDIKREEKSDLENNKELVTIDAPTDVNKEDTDNIDDVTDKTVNPADVAETQNKVDKISITTDIANDIDKDADELINEKTNLKQEITSDDDAIKEINEKDQIVEEKSNDDDTVEQISEKTLAQEEISDSNVGEEKEKNKAIEEITNKNDAVAEKITEVKEEISNGNSAAEETKVTEEKEEKVNDSDAVEEIKEEITNVNDNVEEKKEVVEEVTKDSKVELSIGVYQNFDDFEMYEKLGWKIEELEKDLDCEMDLAEDIDGGKRLSATVSKPREVIVEYGKQVPLDDLPEMYKDLDEFMRATVQDAMDFINEHRYDPSEIYGDDLYEEFMNIPDPTMEPKQIFHQFLYILDELGPYAADKAAFSLLTKLEKLKIKVPYERHFLLLCMCTTTLLKIRGYADYIFSKYSTDWDKIITFCTPKVVRFAEILEQFRPTDAEKTEGSPAGMNTTSKSETKTLKTEEMLNIIDECDFTTLGNRIEDRVNTYELNLKEIEEEVAVAETSDSKISDKSDCKVKDRTVVDSMRLDEVRSLGLRGSRQRVRGRVRVSRNNLARVQQNQQNPDALCGIMFLKEPLMAKIMFMLIVDMSRFRPSLNYICAQYCAVEVTGTEIQECQRQSRKQEDVLKKFRMHECNLLLATSALEEGIDLPRCNLVVRWDVPASYRSHALCRGRARAPRSSLALLAKAPDCSQLLLNHLAIYRELDQIITRKCGCGIQDEPLPEEENHADGFTTTIKPYSPVDNQKTEIDLNTDKTSNKYLEQLIKIISEKKIGDKDNVNKIIKILKDLLENAVNGKRDTTITLNEDFENLSVKEENVNSKIIGIKDIVDSIEGIRNTDNTIEELVEKIDSIYIDRNEFDSKIVDNRQSEIDTNVDRVKVGDCVKKIVESEKVERTATEGDESEKSDKSKKCDVDIASVDLSTAIALINRYCGKLPSDTFTRLAPQWWMEEVELPDRKGDMRKAYICTLRLPLNCPVKYNIVGHPMPTRVLARRMVALQACRILHKSGELDNQLMPIGKENFKAVELESAGAIANGNGASEPSDPNDSARPGTTKRRQYYFKRTALAFTDCQPVIDTSDSEIESTTGQQHKRREIKPGEKQNTLYAIDSRLWCALPERYNTRGRRLHAPQHASQAIGILMARHQPDKLQIPAFPVYTRSGEVRVSVERAADADVRLSPRRARLVRRFMRFVFSDVLRVRRRGMKLQSEGTTHNNYYIVPTVKINNEDGTSKVDIDWGFLELIYNHTEEKRNVEVEKPNLFQQDEEEEEDIEEKKVESRREKDGKVKRMDNPLLKEGETFVFDPEKYKEAVVTPWYRNQDQPQFFLVAEICWNLTPDSAFPSATHTTFRDYYSTKYGVTLTQPNQPLLDVDHTSARLNLLTPRYVNRKGVALPVSSERTRRAKRDRLDQKQILVPELCRVHPFAAPLWFATVALPCVLYRINALLIADEIRRAVAIDVGLGIPKIDEATCPGFQWPPLDFGWSLAEVLSADFEKSEKKKTEEDEDSNTKEQIEFRDLEEKEKEVEQTIEVKEKTINDILQEKEDAESGFEIGTWSNDMASSIPETVDYDEYLEPLPSNLTFCTSASGGTNWREPIEKPKVHYGASRTFSVADSDCSYLSSDFDTDDSDANSEGSDEDTDTGGFSSSKNSNAAMGVRIEYKTAHEAEAVDVERVRSGPPAPQPSRDDDALDLIRHRDCLRAAEAPPEYIEKFRDSVKQHEKEIIDNGFLFDKDRPIMDLLPETSRDIDKTKSNKSIEKSPDLKEIFPYGAEAISFEDGQVTIESVEKNKRLLLEKLKSILPQKEVKKMNCFSMKDVNIDSPNYVNEKLVNVGFDHKDTYKEKIQKFGGKIEFQPYYQDVKVQNEKGFDFDYQPVLEGHPGPSPSVILQALTMSNANDGINLERLETIGDSFLKFAITAYLYCAHPTVHEGKLSHMRSKQVSNLNLYRLGRSKRLGARMTASKFEPHDNWLPPCHRAPPTLHHRPGEGQEQPYAGDGTVDNSGCFIPYNLITQHSIPDKSIADCVEALIGAYLLECGPRGALLFMSWLGIRVLPRHDLPLPENHPYVVAHKDDGEEATPPVVEKSPSPPSPKRQPRISDSDSDWNEEEEEETETEGDQGSQQESWQEENWSWPGRAVGSLKPYKKDGSWYQPIFGELRAPPSPLLRYIEDPEGELEQMLSGYEALERTLQYRFKDRSLLLQALTHASHQKNRLTDCYQRLEFLGDAILDYLITRHLYEDARRHSPGALTDLRSALVNNTIFATLAARHGFHKYFRHMSPGLNEVLTKYVKIQEENGHSISEEHYLIHEDEMEQAEDVEVPKALGDLFESIAGAIFLDSGMSLGAVWRSYVRLMGAELEAFSAAAPKSPVRELLEAEPDTAKFGKPERLADGRRVRVCVEVFGRGAFKGVGRNYRIAKGTAARCALRHLRIHRAR